MAAGETPPNKLSLAIAVSHMAIVRVYLETCIVSGLARVDLQPADASALIRVLEARKAGRVELVTSQVAKAELNRRTTVTARSSVRWKQP